MHVDKSDYVKVKGQHVPDYSQLSVSLSDHVTVLDCFHQKGFNQKFLMISSSLQSFSFETFTIKIAKEFVQFWLNF